MGGVYSNSNLFQPILKKSETQKAFSPKKEHKAMVLRIMLQRRFSMLVFTAAGIF